MRTKRGLSILLAISLVLGTAAGFSQRKDCAAAAAEEKIVVYVAAQGGDGQNGSVAIDKTAVQVTAGDTAETAVKRALDKYYKNNYQYEDGFLNAIGGLETSAQEPWTYWGFRVNGAEPQNPATGWGYGIGDYPLQAHDQISLVYGTYEDMPAECSCYANDSSLAPGEAQREALRKNAQGKRDLLAEKIYEVCFQAQGYVPGIEDTASLYSVFSLARAGFSADAFYDKVCKKVLSQLQAMREQGKICDPATGKETTLSSWESSRNVVLNYTKIALALSAMGVDITDAGGMDLTKKIASRTLYDRANATTLSREAMILFAMSFSGAPWSVGEEYMTEAELVNNLLGDVDHQIGIATDLDSQYPPSLDSAAMVVQALAPYREKQVEGVDRQAVAGACDNVMKLLSVMQDNQTGGFAGNNDNAWTLAQCMTAVGLLEGDADPLTDGNFIKNGKTLFDPVGKYIDLESGQVDPNLISLNGGYQPDQLLRGLTSCLERVEGRGLFDRTVPYVAKTDYTLLSAGNIRVTSPQIYSGKAVIPAVTVTVGGRTLQEGKDYTLACFDNDRVGAAFVVVTGLGEYCGSVKVSFQIVQKKEQPADEKEQPADEKEQPAGEKEQPADEKEQSAGEKEQPAGEKEQQIKKLKRPSIKKLSSAKRGTLTVKFGRTAGAKKYVVQIARNKKFTKGSRKKTVRSCKKVCFKKLKRGVKYYVRVRAYQGSRRSAYSKVKSKKIK